MATRTRWIVLAAGLVLLTPGPLGAGSDDEKMPDLTPLLGEVRTLVQKHYPKAKVTVKDRTIHFEFQTRKYMIHSRFKSGEWQDAHEEEGPQKGGIFGDMTLGGGTYGGQAAMPQWFDVRYFTTRASAPYSKKLDSHLRVDLKCPSDAPKEFLKDFETLANGFEKHVAKPKK